MSDQYIQTLSNEEKQVFLKLFCQMIKADGAIEAEEINFLKQISARYGVDNASIVNIVKNAGNVDYTTEARKITNRKHALQLIKELCVLANVDENLDDSELDIVIDAARVMGIEDEKVVLINRFVLDSLILNKTGKIILEEDNG
jgi:uncharacterized tellurite resistance protein B-like protein